MVKVLFVCLGNICRSPLAEGIFDHMVQQKGLGDKIESDSCGTGAYHIGEIPDSRSIDVAQRNGIKLNHLGRQFQGADFENFDYILAMDDSNFANIRYHKSFPQNGRDIVFKMLDFDNRKSGGDVPDPYFGGPQGFDNVYNLLNESCENLLEQIVKDHQLS